jgi:triosephosphate isomerase
MSRTPLIAGNWKMQKTRGEAEEFVRALLPRMAGHSCDVGICAPFTALVALVEETRGTGVGIYAQNMHEKPSGAFTGEISAPMLTDLDVAGVVLGHSERRELFCETDEHLALKVPAALDAGLEPILCVGETEAERVGGDMERKLRHQIGEDLRNLGDDRLAQVVIAYEPIWAQEAIAFLRALVGDRSQEQAERIRIVYGGSVKADNAEELLALPDVDGALVGGGSLEVDSFTAIVAAA